MVDHDEALDQFLQVYLPQAIYANPPILAKDLKLPTATLCTALERLVTTHQAVQIPHTRNISGYIWREPGAATTKNEKG